MSRERHPDLISVIMPCYNAGKNIVDSVKSVLQQTHQAIELIVINDGSSDDSLEVLGTFEDPRIKIVTQSNQGVCAARNRGLAMAQGEYIAFLDADDTWAPTALEQLFLGLHTRPDVALAYCGWQNVGLDNGRGKPFIPPDYETPDKLSLWIQNCRWPIHAALTRRNAIQSVGGFDARYPTSEDFLLWLRIVTNNKIIRVPEVLAFYYHHEGPRATDDQVRLALNHLSAQWTYLHENSDVRKTLGRSKTRELTFGVLLKRGYNCYWQGDLISARSIFRRVMMAGYGDLKDWKRMLPAFLPLTIHKRLVNVASTATTDIER